MTVHRPPLSSILLLLLLPTPTNSAHSRRRPTSQPHRTEQPDKYDRSITTFSDDGRLLQVEYGMVASERGGTVACLDLDCLVGDGRSEPDDPMNGGGDTDNGDEGRVNRRRARPAPLGRGVIAAVATSSSSATFRPTNDKVHRLDHHALLLTTGLAGDSRALAQTARLACRRLRLQYGEPGTLDEIAGVVGGTQHELTRIGGARPFGVGAVLMGVDPLPEYDPEEEEEEEGANVRGGGVPQLYRTGPGGSVDRCDYCATGRGWMDATRALGCVQDSVRRGLGISLQQMEDDVEKERGDADHRGDVEGGRRHRHRRRLLSEVVRGVASAVLDADGGDGSGKSFETRDSIKGGEGGGERAVDLWFVRPSPGRRGGASIVVARGVTADGIDEACRHLVETML